jgi:hypothetical protein
VRELDYAYTTHFNAPPPMTIRIDAAKKMTSITSPFIMNFVHWSYAIFKVLNDSNF